MVPGLSGYPRADPSAAHEYRQPEPEYGQPRAHHSADQARDREAPSGDRATGRAELAPGRDRGTRRSATDQEGQRGERARHEGAPATLRADQPEAQDEQAHTGRADPR